MNISLTTVLALASEGRMTLQIPMFYIGSPNSMNPATNYPDEYFVFLKVVGTKHRIAVGREQGFLYLSKKGYNYFKPQLETAFKTAIASRGNRGKTWSDFEDHADTFFDEVRQKSSEQLIRLQAEVQIKPTTYNQNRVTEMAVALQTV